MNKELCKESLMRHGYKELDKNFTIVNLSTLTLNKKVNYTVYLQPIMGFIVLVYKTYMVSINENHRPIINTYVFFDNEK